MNDLIEKARALEATHRKTPQSPRAWAARIQDGKATLEDTPEHMREIIQSHLYVYTERTAFAILKEKGSVAKLVAFNLVPEGMRDAVRKRVHELADKTGGK